MPRLRVIALDKLPDSNTYRYVLWADVPVARQRFYARPGAVSAWLDATAADNSAIASGAVSEKVDTIQVPTGSTLNQIKAFLDARAAVYQSEITNTNLWARYGTTFDGTTWADGGVA